jgi:hypothetical protein
MKSATSRLLLAAQLVGSRTQLMNARAHRGPNITNRFDRGDRYVWAVAALLVSSALLACGPNVIEDSPVVARDAEIADTPEHREIVEVVERYRRALEDKDVGTLRQLISSDYYENGGTSHTTLDDYGYDELTQVFQVYAQTVRQLRLSVQIHNIEVEGDRANVYVEFGYNMLYMVDGQERWHVDQDTNRLELVREGAQWRVIAGL